MYLEYMGEEIPTNIVRTNRVLRGGTTRGRHVTGTIRVRSTATPVTSAYRPTARLPEPIPTRPTLAPVDPTFDPYARQKSQCASRTGFRWDDRKKQCVSTDPFVAQKNRCALMGGRWDSTRNTCQTGRGTQTPTESTEERARRLCLARGRGYTYQNGQCIPPRVTGPTTPVPVPQEPFLPPKPPETSVLDQRKDTNGAPPNMIDPDRSGGGGSTTTSIFTQPIMPRALAPQTQQGSGSGPISVSVKGGGGGGGGAAPNWLVPAIVGAAMFLL